MSFLFNAECFTDTELLIGIRWQHVLPKRLAEELQINVAWLPGHASLLSVPKPETTTQRKAVLAFCT